VIALLLAEESVKIVVESVFAVEFAHSLDRRDPRVAFSSWAIASRT
jgi:hypothetical protein